MALASLNAHSGGMLSQTRTEAGRAEFYNIIPGDYSLDVSAAGYETVHQELNIISQATIANILLRPSGSSNETTRGKVPGAPVLSPKAQKLLTKALESLRAKRPDDARAALEQALHLAPAHPDVHYLYGVYSMETQDLPGAMGHWEKALNLYPKHFGSLMFMSEGFLIEKKPTEAIPYLNRAIEVVPTAWRPHAMIAQANLMMGQGHYDEAVHEAERAMELGHSQAVSVEPILAQALVAQGKKDRAVAVLEQYVQERPQDAAARKMLDGLRGVPPAAAPKAPPG